MQYNNLMFSNVVHIDNWSLYVLMAMLLSSFVPYRISSTTTWKELLTGQLKFVGHLLYHS